MHICSPEDFEARYVRPKEGRTLIVGSKVYPGRIDRRTRYSNVIGIDKDAGEGVNLVLDLEMSTLGLGFFSHIDCLSVLEHSRQPWLLAMNLWSLLEPRGTIYLTVPFVWRVHYPKMDFWRFTPEAVRLLFPSIEWVELQFVNSVGEKGVPNIQHEGSLYFIKSEVCGVGVKR